jgi:hypothetical protein
MTRCGIQFFQAHFAAAFRWNPLVFMGLSSVIAFDIYAVFVLVTRAPRLRIRFSKPSAKTFVRVSMVLALALNWTYLLLHWQNF